MVRLSWIVRGLVRVLWGKREHGFFTALVVQTIGARIGRAAHELQTLMAAFQAGTLRTRRPPKPGRTRRKPVPRTEPVEPDPMKLVTVPLPRAFGWLLTLLAWEVAPFRNELEVLLDDPDVKALLAASPRAVRAVRSLCRMLGVMTPRFPAPLPPRPPTDPNGDRTPGVAPVDAPAGAAKPAAPRGGVRSAGEQVFENRAVGKRGLGLPYSFRLVNV